MLRWHQSPGGQPHRVGDQRDEPVPDVARARSWPRTARRAAVPGGHGVRPVRVPRSRCPDLRPLQRRPLRRRRHAGRGDSGAGGWSASEHDHRIDRHRAPGDHLRRTGVRAGARLAAVRWLAAPRRGPTARACTSGCRPARSTRRRSRAPSNGSAPSGCAPMCWPAVIASSSRADRPRSSSPRREPSSPKPARPRSSSTPRASQPSCWT